MRKHSSLFLFILAILLASILLSGAAAAPQPFLQATETPDADAIMLTPPLARTPLPTDMPGSGGNGWMAASLMFFLCMVGMLIGGIMIAFIVVRLRTRRG